MKKIIEPGGREFTGKCSNCGCKFTYELEDISFRSVQCPHCGDMVSHPNQTEDDIVTTTHVDLFPYPYPSNAPSLGKDVWYETSTPIIGGNINS